MKRNFGKLSDQINHGETIILFDNGVTLSNEEEIAETFFFVTLLKTYH